MKKIIVEELERIRTHDRQKMLKPRAVVEAARVKSNPLHTYFEWDNSIAAERYRLDQARDLIVSVQITRDGIDNPFQAYVSLPSSRIRKGGGYHGMADVMSSKELRLEMLKSAMNDLENFQERYRRLEELAEVFTAISRVKSRK